MNEIQLIRQQLESERQHASAVANACAQALASAAARQLQQGSPLERFRQACVDYLVCVLAWFEERDQRLADYAQARLTAADPVPRRLEEVLAQAGRSREALERLEAAVASDGTAERWQEFVQFFNGAWSARREALETLLAAHARTNDWRALSGIDADSILEERRRYAQVSARLPPGIELAGLPQRPGA
jgi:hypothetical protein